MKWWRRDNMSNDKSDVFIEAIEVYVALMNVCIVWNSI